MAVLYGYRRFAPAARPIISALRGSFRKTGAPGRASANTADDSITGKLRACLIRFEADTAAMTVKTAADSSLITIRVPVPRGRPVEYLVWSLTQTADEAGFTVADCEYDEKKERGLIRFTPADGRVPEVRLAFSISNRYFSATARVAFLIRDFGFEPDQTTLDFLSFPAPLTVTMIPAGTKSEWTSKIADHYRKEVVIALPMESHAAVSPPAGASVIMIHHSAEQISGHLSRAASRIPEFSGFINQWGTRVMQDSRVMEIVLTGIKKEHGYFIDTKITPNSVAPAVARRLKVPFRAVDFEIPKNADAAAVDILLSELTAAAQNTGSALAAGYPTPALIGSLKKRLPSFAENGVTLVYVSAIVDHGDR